MQHQKAPPVPTLQKKMTLAAASPNNGFTRGPYTQLEAEEGPG